MKDTQKKLQEILKALSEQDKETKRSDQTRTKGHKPDDNLEKEEPAMSQAALFFLGR